MRRLAAVCVFALGLSGVGVASAPDKRALPAKDVSQELSSADAIELLSLEPKRHQKEDGDKDVRVFHGHRVLGALAVQPEEKLKLVRQGVCDSLSDDRSIRALCFRPRHGIVAKKGEKVLCEVLICYECQSAELYDGEEYRGAISIRKGFEKHLNKLLTKNKIPIAD
jgi:hypothetical protein